MASRAAREMAAELAFRLRRLEAMREVAVRLMGRDRLGRDVFARGAPEGVRVLKRSVFELSLYEMLRAYAEHAVRREDQPLSITPAAVYSVKSALGRLGGLIGEMADWTRLRGVPAARACRRFPAPLGARLDLRGQPRARAFGRGGAAPGPCLRPDLSPPPAGRGLRR